MPDYSLTGLINRVRGRVRQRRMISSPYHEIIINHPLRPTTTIQNLTFYEAQQRVHQERLQMALESLNLTPSKISELMRKLEDEHHQRTYKFDDDLKWLSEHADLKLVTTRRSKHPWSKTSVQSKSR